MSHQKSVQVTPKCCVSHIPPKCRRSVSSQEDISILVFIPGIVGLGSPAEMATGVD